MANLLEYVVNVRDRASATMQRLGSNAMEVTNRLQGMQNESVVASKALREMGAPANTLQRQLTKIKDQRGWVSSTDVNTLKQMNTEIKALERQIHSIENTTNQSKLGGWFSDAFNQIPFAGLLTNPLVLAGAAAGSAISKGIKQDLDNSSFEVFLKSEAAAEQLSDDIGKIKMDKGALSNAAKQMLSQQVNQNDILPLLSSMGDISGGQSETLGSLALAYSQVNSAGRLFGQELNQLINAGFNPLVQMSKTTGKSVTQLKVDMSKGLITSAMVKQSFIDATKEGGQYHGMLDKMANTLGGKWNEFMVRMNNGLLRVYKVIGPVAEKVLELGGAALDATANGIGWFFEKLEKGEPIVVGLVVVMGSLITSMMLMKTWSLLVSAATGVMTAAQWALNAAMTANPIGLIIAGIVALLALIGYLIYRTDGWGEAWTHTVDSVKSLWSGLTNYMMLKWESFSGGIMNGIDHLIVAWQKFKGLMGDDSAESQIKVIEQRIEERNKRVADRSKQVAYDFASSWSSAKQATGSLKWNDKTLVDMMGDMKKSLGIVSPDGVPGTSTINSTIGGGNADKQGSNTAITTGGTKHNYITITMNDLIGVLNISKGGFKESADEMEEHTTDALLRVLGSAVSAGN